MNATKRFAADPTESVTKTYGALAITAARTVDGGYSINVYAATGGHRHDELCLTTADRDTYRLAYQVIREGALKGVQPEGIHEALRDALVRDLHEVQRRRDSVSRSRIGHINRALDQLDTPADRAVIEELTAHVTNAFTDLAAHGRRHQVTPTKAPGKASKAQLAALAYAVDNGWIDRGGKTGQASITILQAMARPSKNWVTLVHKPGTAIVIGAIPTPAGRREHKAVTR